MGEIVADIGGGRIKVIHTVDGDDLQKLAETGSRAVQSVMDKNSGFELLVTPAELKNKSTEVQTVIRDIERRFDEMCSEVDSTVGYWVGEAGDEYRRKFREYDPEREEIIRRLTEEVTDLQKIAGVYEEKESEAAEIAGGLPAEVIS